MKRFWLTLIALGIAAVLSSCQTLMDWVGFKPVPPQVTLENLKIKTFTPVKLVLEAKLLVQNPNSFDIKVKKLDWRLEKEQQLIVSTHHADLIAIKSQDAQSVTLPLVIETGEVLKLLLKLFAGEKTQEFTWQVDGTYASPIGDLPFHYRDKKTVKADGLFKFF